MKINLSKFYIAAFYFCSTYMMFAQPGTGSDNGGVDDDGSSDTTGSGAPIDDYIWLMVILGLVFAFLKFKANYQNAKRMSN